MTGQEVIVVKNDHKGVEVWRYPGKIIAQSPKGFIVEAYFNRRDLEFNGIILKKDDRFLELYLFDKWFNLFEIYDKESRFLKARYCNITRPIRVSNNYVYYDDLALDLLVFPDRSQLLLDEDEFIDLGLENLEQEKARAAMLELKTIFSQSEKVNVFDLL
jgi:predicted RNA-binding protein associated with RNAse of E/G family